jgi:large subunit ribosomal protein L18
MALRTKSMDREQQRVRRHRRVRRTIIGTADRPRLVVHRSSKNIQGHLADDVLGRILLGVSTLSAEVRDAAAAVAAPPPPEPAEAEAGGKGKKGKKRAEEDKPAAQEGAKAALSRAAGKLLAEKAKAVGITRVVFDRGGYLYHGRVAAFAEGAREGGLEF